MSRSPSPQRSWRADRVEVESGQAGQSPAPAGRENLQRVALRSGLPAAPRAGHVVRVDGHARRDGVLNNSATSGRGSARRQRRATSSWRRARAGRSACATRPPAQRRHFSRHDTCRRSLPGGRPGASAVLLPSSLGPYLPPTRRRERAGAQQAETLLAAGLLGAEEDKASPLPSGTLAVFPGDAGHTIRRCRVRRPFLRIALLTGGDGWHVRDLVRAATRLGRARRVFHDNPAGVPAHDSLKPPCTPPRSQGAASAGRACSRHRGRGCRGSSI